MTMMTRLLQQLGRKSFNETIVNKHSFINTKIIKMYKSESENRKCRIK